MSNEIEEKSQLEDDGSFIKNFVLNCGRKIVDFFAWLGLIIAIIVLGVSMNMFFENMSFELFLIMIFAPILILLATIISNYFIYLLIDIRDSLKELTKK